MKEAFTHSGPSKFRFASGTIFPRFIPPLKCSSFFSNITAHSRLSVRMPFQDPNCIGNKGTSSQTSAPRKKYSQLLMFEPCQEVAIIIVFSAPNRTVRLSKMTFSTSSAKNVKEKKPNSATPPSAAPHTSCMTCCRAAIMNEPNMSPGEPTEKQMVFIYRTASKLPEVLKFRRQYAESWEGMQDSWNIFHHSVI